LSSLDESYFETSSWWIYQFPIDAHDNDGAQQWQRQRSPYHHHHHHHPLLPAVTATNRHHTTTTKSPPLPTTTILLHWHQRDVKHKGTRRREKGYGHARNAQHYLFIPFFSNVNYSRHNDEGVYPLRRIIPIQRSPHPTSERRCLLLFITFPDPSSTTRHLSWISFCARYHLAPFEQARSSTHNDQASWMSFRESWSIPCRTNHQRPTMAMPRWR
jgi:hypothetical protein